MRKTIKIFCLTFCTILLLPQQTKAAGTLPLSDEQQLFDFYYLEAVRERLAEDYDCSLEMLERCLDIDPNSAAVFYEFASVYSLKNNRTTAIEHLNRAIELDPDNDWYKLSLAMLYLSANDWKTAGDVYEKVLAKHPDNEEIIYYLSQIYGTTGDWQKLIDLLNLHQQRYGISEEVSLQKFQACHALGKTKQADAEIDALIKAFPNEGKYWVMRGKIYDEAKDYKNAAKYYEQALTLDPDNVIVYLAFADHYKALKNETRAINYIETAFRNKNIDEEAKVFMLGEYVKHTEQTPQMEAVLDRLFGILLETKPESPDLTLMYGHYLLATQRVDDAKKQFRTALTIDDKNGATWYGLLQADIVQNDMPALLNTAGEALEHLPDDAMFYYYEGIAHSNLKDDEAAIRSYECGLEVADSADVMQKSNLYFSIGEVYRMQNNYKPAFEYYDKALEENPYNIGVLNNYAYTLAEEDLNLDKAERMAKICLEQAPNEASFLDTYGWIMYKQGFYNLAQDYIKKALQHGENKSQTVWEHLGDVLLKLDNKSEAVEAWKKAAALEGENTAEINAKILKNAE